ncbi:MAG TPA: hypothetical protein PK867_11730 [Pirellulales bacterium]|nr:hypothetical protein [Pirellulales bacterium]
MQIASGPVVIADLEPPDIAAVLGIADSYHVDLTDATLLHLVRQHAASYLASDDQHFAKVCGNLGITVVSPLDTALRQAVAVWETAHVPPKGLARVLRRVHQWLSQSHAQAAQDFWSNTGAGSHLP